MKVLIYVYKKCSTCQSALSFLKKHHAAFEEREITKTPPSIEELKKMLFYENGSIKKLFNTSGLLYKEMHLKERLENLNEEEALNLLTQHGMLVKRPFLLGQGFGLLGFKEEEWSKKFRE